MIRLHAGDSKGCCDHLSRRSFLQLGAAGLASLSLPQILRARDAAPSGKDTRVILLWLEGGPSHIDLWDMKPGAPAEYRGFWRPIATNVPGMQITEMFPRQAKVADKFSIIRTLHHGDNDHIGAPHILLTGRVGPTIADQEPKAPSMGSIVSRTLGARRTGLPAYVVVPKGGGKYFGAHYAGAAYDPFDVAGDPNRPAFKIHNLTLSQGMSVARLDDRRSLRRSLDTLRRDADDSGSFDAMDKFEKQAFELVTSNTVSRAFDVAAEPDEVRDRYGRTTWGQSTLLARRMVEAGVSFVTVNMGGWDQHGDLKARMDQYLPTVDRAVSALFQDLSASGLLEKTLVVVGGEFGRTPRMNTGFQGQPAGRDHWNNAFSMILGGGGIKGGRIVGKTDAKAESIVERPVTVEQLHATMYHALGINPDLMITDRSGRPVPIVDGNEPIRELL